MDPFAAFRKALRMWLPHTAVSVDFFHVTLLANDMLTTVRQGLSLRVRGRRGRATDPAWANLMLLLKVNENPSERGQHRLAGVFAADDPTGSLQAAWHVKEQLRTLLKTGSLEATAAAKTALTDLVERAAMPETNRLYRTVCRWWAEIEVLIVTGATTAKVKANNTAINHIKRKSVNRPRLP
ncbi:transposase [Pseudarthrobacter sp. MDT3-28]|nr:transposase [Pseudarthrobacter sp. MDT3-28]